MAREHANIRIDMWGDADWRSLSRDAQWLYELLLTHPDTNRAGVCDWRPGRLAQMASGTTRADVKRAAAELQARFFIVIDEETEEVLVRSYVKYDGVLKQPNLSVTMAKDWSGVGSTRLRAVVAFEVQRLRLTRPEWPVWGNEKLQTLLSTPGLDVKADPSVDPTSHPSVDPSIDPSVGGQAHPSVRGHATSTATSTSTNASHSSARAKPKSREVNLPKDWAPTSEHLDRARSLGVDLASEAENFRLHAEAHDRKVVNWNAAFTMWLKKAKPSNVTPIAPGRREDIRDGIRYVNGVPKIGGPDGMTVEQFDAWREQREAEQAARFGGDRG